jgi:hypothetical protein
MCLKLLCSLPQNESAVVVLKYILEKKTLLPPIFLLGDQAFITT